MANRARPRDSQKAKFWKWVYGGMISDFPNIRNHVINQHDIETVFNSQCARLSIAPPRYRTRKNSRAKISYRTDEFTYYPTQLNVGQIAVAVAWHQMFACGSSDSWHGPQFCTWVAEALSNLTKIPVDDIKDSMRRANLKLAGVNPKTSSRMLKQYQLAEQRAAQIETSIRLPRGIRRVPEACHRGT